MKSKVTVLVFLSLNCLDVTAGNLQGDVWQASSCGEKPVAPVINTKSADDFNKSVKDINTWQEKSQEYYNCLVTEANTDNDTIAKSAIAAQDEYQQEVNRIQKEANEGRSKLERH